MSQQKVIWGEFALETWRRLGMQEAKAVAVAVDRWAERGEGLAIFEDGELRLFVGAHVVGCDAP